MYHKIRDCLWHYPEFIGTFRISIRLSPIPPCLQIWAIPSKISLHGVLLNDSEQISEGATTLAEISSKSRVEVTNLPKYLKVLENMGLIKKSFELPFQFVRIGKWWYKDKEIDLIALNKQTKQIAFFEVKWHEFERLKEAKGIIEALKAKSKFVSWFNDAREDYFWLVAKKMGEEVKAALRNEGYLVFDMAELKNHNTNLFATK